MSRTYQQHTNPKTDLEIARNADYVPITELASSKLNLDPSQLINFGNNKAKIKLDAGKTQEVGKMYSGTTNEVRKKLDKMLSKKETVIAEVRYLYATKDSILFQPVFVRLRKDKSLSDCVLSQLAYSN